MIESGIWSWVITNPALQPLLGQSLQDKSDGFYNSFYFSFLPKKPTLPGIILDRLKSDEAADTLDARTAAAGMMIEAKFQFGCAARDNPENPANPNGYLSAMLLSRQLRLQIMGLATGGSSLPDGTPIRNVRIDGEYDAHFELGDQGYIYRRVLAVTIWYSLFAE
jgi:hypothetical protein